MAIVGPESVAPVIRTPDQRLRVFISSTLGELAPERVAVKGAIERLHLAPVMFEDGARPHAPRALYRAYLAQSHVFIGIYWQRYGWIADGETISGLEDEYRLAGNRPRLLYIKEPAPQREERLGGMIAQFQADDQASYKRFSSIDELVGMVGRDLALLLSERFEATAARPPVEPVQPATTPIPLTQTRGRAREVEAVRTLLAGGARLLTLTGPGGVGKTRLSQTAALSLAAQYPDGIYFVPLETVTAASLVARVIVDRLGIRTEGTWSPEAALAHHLKDRRALLVLDNLEQIEDIGLAVRQMLERCPTLQILATSRRALRVGGEQELPVPPLPLPTAGAGAPFDRQPAIELFTDRVRNADPGFAPDDKVLGTIADICRRVDGLPLAIELAAARMRLLAPTDILQRLRSGFELLSSRSTDLPARQQTLRATLDWSYDLLAPGERSLLGRLSIFEGSFSLEAATAICGHAPVDIVDDLTGLLDSSLILPSDEPGSIEPRFRMLQTVRDYAADRLAEAGEAASIRKRFVAWYRQLSDRAAPFLCGPNQRDWTARLDPERANLRAVVRAALDIGDFGNVVGIVWNVIVFYRIRDANAETRGWIEETVAAKPALDTVTAARLDVMEAQVRAAAGNFDGIEQRMAGVFDLFIARDLRLEAAVTQMVRAEVHLHRNKDLAAAEAALQKSLQLFASVGHDWGIALTQIEMSLLHWMDGKVEAARACLKDALIHARRIENEPQIARSLCLMAMLGGKADASDIPLLRDAAEIVVRGQYRTEAAACLEALALSLHLAGRAAEACTAASLSEGLRQQLQIPRPPPLIGALSAAGISAARPAAGAAHATDMTFAFLSDMLLKPGRAPGAAVTMLN